MYLTYKRFGPRVRCAKLPPQKTGVIAPFLGVLGKFGALEFILLNLAYTFLRSQRVIDLCLFVCLMLNGTSAPVGPLVPR